MFNLLSLLLLAGCDPDAGLTVVNAEPEAEFTSHLGGETLEELSLVSFRGRYWDTDGDEADLTVTWLLDGVDGACSGGAISEDGATACDVVVPAEDFRLTIEVSDTEGATGLASLELLVEPNDSPVAVLTAPESGGLYYTDQKMTFEGTVSDDEEDSEALVAWFESDLDGAISAALAPTADGYVADYANLTEGQHAVSLVVEDSAGQTGSDTVLITVGPPNRAPTCAITTPESGAVSQEGELVTFEATVDDEDVAEDWLAVTWASDRDDGDLGASTPSSSGEVLFATSELSAATHTITMTATDEVGATCSDLVLVTVGTPPTIDWISPEADTLVNDGDAVVFTAEVEDAQDAATSLTVSWSSALDGSLSSQGADTDGVAGFTTSSLSVGVHDMTLTVTDSDGLAATSWRTLTVNGLATAPVIALTPDPATTADDLAVSVTTDAVDPEGDAISYAYAWEVDGAPSSASSGSALSAADTAKGERWTVIVTPSDGTGTGDAAEASVTIDNTTPAVSGVSISPDPAAASDALTCSYSFSDADGDPDESTLSWTVDGSAVGTGETLSGAFVGGQVVVCTVTPSDGEQTGTPVSSASLTIDNSTPTVSDVAIAPDPATASDVLTCSYTFDDDDGDTDASDVAWRVGGSPVGTGTTLAGAFVGGDVVVCQVTPGDGASSGAMASASITISNSVPVVTDVDIQPDPATAADTLTCSYSFSDDDGDSDGSTVLWTVDGTPAGVGTTLAGGFLGGEQVSCTVTPGDGSDSGTEASDSLVISNTAPTVTDVAIDPDPAQVDDTLTCSWSWSDIDGDADASTVAWDVGGTTVGTGTTLSGAFAAGDSVTCTVASNDGQDAGNEASESVTISNSVPVLADVTLSPDPAQESDVLTCTPGSTSDADGTLSFTYAYAWSVGGVDPGETSNALGGAAFDKGDTVACSVTPHDGTEDGDPVSSNQVTVENTAPTLGGVSISPSTPGVADTLTCTAAGFSDDDGDSDLSTWSWALAGTEVGTDATLSGAFSTGDTVTCTVTPSDGDDEGTALSDAVVVGNSPPEATSVTLSPDPVGTEDTLTATVTTDDADGDTVTVSYAWTVDGVEVSETTASLAGTTWFDKDQQVTVTVTPNDGTDDGAALGAETVTVSNTPASAPTVSVAMVGDDDDSDGDGVADSVDACEGYDDADWVALETGERCVQVIADTGATWSQAQGDCEDFGGHLVRLASAEDNAHIADLAEGLDGEHLWIGYTDDASDGTWLWTDGGATTYTNWRSGEPSGETGEDCAILYLGGEWNDLSCDGNNQEAGFACQVEVTPAEPDLVCTLEMPSTDDDGDTLSYSFSWDVDGTPFAGGTTTTETGDTVAYSDRDFEQTWTCSVVANDGDDDSDSGTASYDTPSNEPPGAPGVFIDPAGPEEGVDDLVCEVSGESDDPERDAVTYAFSWDVDGEAYSDATTTTSTGDTVPASDTTYLEEWTCTITPSDAYNVGTPGTATATIDPPCATYTDAGVEYWFCEDELAWDDAEAYCNDYGLNLANIHGDAENVFLASSAARVPVHAANEEFWIGLEDLNGGGGEDWVWTDGTAMDYTSWNETQPDSNSQDCVVMILNESDGYGAGHWHDSGCTSRKAFACE